jgi:hypothetical protein
VAVSITPPAADVPVGQAQAFSATVTHTTNTAVTWSVAEGASGGSIDSSGNYLAPGQMGVYHVTATSAADPNKKATATVTVHPAITLTPASATLNAGQMQSFVATVAGAANQAVVWSVMEGSSGGSIDQNGVYQAPGTTGTYHVIATSVADATVSASAAITVTSTPQVYVSVTPLSAPLDQGATQQFNGSVTGSGNTNLTWSIFEGSTGGTVDASGLYTAPNHAGTYHVVATSQADTSKQAIATVTVAPVVLTVNAPSGALNQGASFGFQATVTGSVNLTVSWTAQCGMLTSTSTTSGATNTFTAPAMMGTTSCTVTATSAADTSQTAMRTVSINTVAVSVGSLASTMNQGAAVPLTATVTGASNPAVSWTLSPSTPACGTVTACTLTGNTTTCTFTAGKSPGNCSVTATSASDGSANSTSTSVNPVVVTILAPTTATLAPGQTWSFTAVVSGTVDSSVTWYVLGAAGGTVNATGTYYAPTGAIGSDTVYAQSNWDTSKNATATVNVTTTVVVAISPPSATLNAGQKQSFSATVTGTANSAVTWSTSGGGSIDALGVYTAPSSCTGSCTVTATSVADGTKSATATVTVTATPQISVSISPQSVSTNPGRTQSFSATVTPGSANQAVTWSILEGTGGGSINNGVYTPPSSSGTYHVVATSVADTSKSAVATVDVTTGSPVAITISPTQVTLVPSATKTFIANVTGTSNTAVIWSAVSGTIDASGHYTAPSSPTTDTVTATSVADSTKQASASITVTNTVTVTVSPSSATVPSNGTRQFKATVTGTASPSIAWSASSGSIDANGLFTAPSGTGPVTITATETVSMAKGTASVTVNTSTTILVSGTVTYSGTTASTGSIYVTVNEQGSGNGICGTHLNPAGAYTIRCPSLNTGANYKVQAFEDGDGSGMYSYALDNVGSSPGGFTYSGSDVTGQNVALGPPPAVTWPAGAPVLQQVIGSSQALTVFFGRVSDANGNDLADSYRVYVASSPNPGPSNYVALRTAPSTDQNVVIVPATSGNTYYVAVSGVRGSVEGPLSSASWCGQPSCPIIASSAVGSVAVSESVDLTGVTATGPLSVYGDCGTAGIFATEVFNPTGVENLMFDVAASSTCRFGALIDQLGDGLLGPLDPMVDGATVAIGTTPVTLPGITISSSNVVAVVNTHHSQDDQVPVNDWYSLDLAVQSNFKVPVAATLESGPGPGSNLPVDLPNLSMNGHYDRAVLGTSWLRSVSTPVVGDTYTFTVTYADGTVETLTGQVTVVFTVMPTPTSPASGATGVGTPTTLTWTEPSALSTLQQYVYISTTTGPSVWDSSTLNPGVTSTPYGGPSLTPGTKYQFGVSARDNHGNSADKRITFTD